MAPYCGDMSRQSDLERLHPSAWRWALAVCGGDRDFAHDVLHEAYIAILEGRASWSERSAYKTWVFGVIRMVARAQGRRRTLARFRFPALAPDTRDAVGPPPGEPILQSLVDALNALPRRQAQIAELVFGQDFTVEEAAEAMGVSLGSARTHYARAKTRLRETLGQNTGERHD